MRRLAAAVALTALASGGGCDPTVGLQEAIEQASRPRPPKQRAARTKVRPRPVTPLRTPPQRDEGGSTEVLTVSSTAYCLTGTMANGKRVYRGAVAMNGVPMGSRWQVDGGGTYTVADRIGHGSGFDIAMPGDCDAAKAYGRRTITVRRIG